MNSLADRLEADGVPQAVLIRATETGRFGVLANDTDEDRISPAMLASLRGDYLVVLATHNGPGRVASAVAVRRWAKFAFIHVSTPREKDYRTIAAMTERHGRMLLIETQPSLVSTWMAFLSKEIPTVALMGRSAT